MSTIFSVVSYLTFAVIGILATQWDDLRVTYGLTPFSGQGKYSIQRIESDAVQDGWVQISSDDCSNGGRFNGFRYLYEKDGQKQYDRVVLYDIQGTVAGIQILLPKRAVLASKSTIELQSIPMYQSEIIDGVEYLTLTAYFQNPDNICAVGRSKEVLETKGTGDGLWFQNGDSPADSIQVPLVRSDAIDEGWSENACFPQMGIHNFYQLDTWDKTDCNQIRPAFLLFNNDDELSGFGFVSPGNVTSDYFENPPYLAIKLIASPNTPVCLKKMADDVITSMHVYFEKKLPPFLCTFEDFLELFGK